MKIKLEILKLIIDISQIIIYKDFHLNILQQKHFGVKLFMILTLKT